MITHITTIQQLNKFVDTACVRSPDKIIKYLAANNVLVNHNIAKLIKHTKSQSSRAG